MDSARLPEDPAASLRPLLVRAGRRPAALTEALTAALMAARQPDRASERSVPWRGGSLRATARPTTMPLRHYHVSVRARLMAWNVCAVALLLVVLGAITQYSVRAVLLAAVDRDLADHARPFTDRHRPPLGGPPPFPAIRGGSPPGGGPMGHPLDSPARLPQEPRNGQPGAGPEHGPDGQAGPPPDSFALGPMIPPPGPNDHNPGRPLTDRELRIRARSALWPRELDLDGNARFPMEGQGPWDAAAFQQAAQGASVYSTITADSQEVRLLSVPMRDAGTGAIEGVAQIPHGLADTNRAIHGLAMTQLALIPVALLLAGLGGAAVTGRAGRTVAQMARTANRIGAEDLSRRLEVGGDDAFSHLATTINGMLSRLEQAFAHEKALNRELEVLLEKQQRFTADASHELKTPLSVIKLHVGLLRHSAPSPEEYRESVEDIERAADRMTRLVQDLLILARHDATRVRQLGGVVSASDLLDDALQNVAGPPGAPIDIDVPDRGLTVAGNAPELARVFTNLLDNARRHTPSDGSIRVSARPAPDAPDTVEIVVSDNGEGIPAEHIAHLGERFYRVDSARARSGGGSGLGLSICLSIVEEHGGSIHFESAVGVGTTVTVCLPRGSAVAHSAQKTVTLEEARKQHGS